MRRREFLCTAAVCIAALPAGAQQSRTRHRVGSVFVSAASVAKQFEDALLKGLHDLGYAVGGNLAFDVRYAEGEVVRLPALVDELIALKPDVLVGISQVARIMMEKTTSIPIVLPSSSDPVGAGLVKSLARPGGNVTGISNLMGPLVMKQIEILSEVVPRFQRVALLNDTILPSNAALFDRFAAEAARVKRVAFTTYHAATQVEITAAFAKMETERPDALVVAGSALFLYHRDLIAQNAARLRLPAIYAIKEHVQSGGLMSYGASVRDGYRRAATFIDKILKGTNPAELPIEQATTFELFVNLRTARALGLNVPSSLLARADEVIE